MIKTLIAVAVAGACALPLAAASAAGDKLLVAQAGGGAGATANNRFNALDKNHDGFISRDEAKDAAELNTRFTELDANNDGKLSREEYNGVNASARGATGSTADSTATGKAKAKAGAPDKGPGAQEPANRALGTAGSGVPEGGGTSTSK